MSLDGKILKAARERLEQRKAARQAELDRRRAEVYRKNPRVREIDQQIRGSIADVIGFALSHGQDPADAVGRIREENLELQRERIEEIQAAGFPANYLDDGPMCPRCGDTGYDGTGVCSCLTALYRDEQRKELSRMLDLGADTFDSFNIDYYDDTPDPKTGVSPRSNMDFVYETCVRYAEKFDTAKMNLLLSGGTGLGKTFLSTCIARAVSEKGFSVVYDTAPELFARMENDKFGRGEDPGALREDVERDFRCDLLIVDDLGTEMVTAFTISALYNLINSRLATGKKTVINTNMTPEELRRRYSPQIASRLEGEYQLLLFWGRDIRLQKKEQRLSSL